MYFNYFLPPSKKNRIPINITGDIVPISTQKIERSSMRVGELERDATAFMSENYKEEVDEKTKALLKHIVQSRKIVETSYQQPLAFQDPNALLEKYKDNVKALVEGDPRPPYIVKSSSFKSPQSTVHVAYYPEKEFVFRLIESNLYLDSWIKSPDKGFYSIEYEYWKGGKDRILRGFNPDFFINIDLDRYLKVLKGNKIEKLDHLKDLQEKGVTTIIRVVEIKSDEDGDEATPAKAEKAKIHFEALNVKLSETNPMNISKKYRSEIKQHYTFDLLKPAGYTDWFSKLKRGDIL